MRTRSLAALSSNLLLVAALAFPPSSARAAARPAKDCARLVGLYVQKFDRSKASELQQQVQADKVAGEMVDAIGKQASLGAAWKAGNPFWEEARALLQPDLAAAMRAGAQRELLRIEAKLPAKLDGAVCRKAMAIADSTAGAIAIRIEDGLDLGRFLASFEKQFPVPERLKPLADAARREAADWAALERAPEAQRAGPKLASLREDWRRYSRYYTKGLMEIGEADPAVEQKATAEASAKLVAKNREAVAGIVARFRAAAGK